MIKWCFYLGGNNFGLLEENFSKTLNELILNVLLAKSPHLIDEVMPQKSSLSVSKTKENKGKKNKFENNKPNKSKKTLLSLEDIAKNKKLLKKDESVEILEDDLSDLDEDDTSEISFQYSLGEEEFLAKQFYQTASLDYMKMFYGESKSIKSSYENEYFSDTIAICDVEADLLSTVEAESAFKEIQYAAIVGTGFSVNSEKKRKFDMWIKFNPALFGLFHSLYAVTDDVNYAPLT